MIIRNFFYNSWTGLVAGIIGMFSPVRSMSYRRDRQAVRDWYAASKKGPNQRWLPKTKSADAELRKQHKIILSRCRDVVKNSPYIKGAITKIINNCIRSGIKPQAKITRLGGSPAPKINKELESLWARWTKAENCDVSGHDSYYSLQKLILRHLWTDGQVLVHRVFDPDAKPVPFRIEVLECDLLDDRKDGLLENGNIARRGIEFNAAGRPVAYHLMDNHPGDYLFAMPASRRIPAEDIIHIYEKERASQTQGVSWLVSVVMDVYDLNEYQAYERIGAKLAAAFGIFIKSVYPETYGPGPMSQGEDSNDELTDYIEPGRIQKLPMGTEIQVASHNRPGETYAPYVATSLRGVSAGRNMSYEALSNDYTSASDSSARSASLEERLSYQGMQTILNEKVNVRVWAWFLDAVFLAGMIKLPGYAMDRDRIIDAHTWQNPGWSWVDPQKDSNAAKTELELGITTRRKLAAQRGEDWDEVIEELAREKQVMDEYGISAVSAENTEETDDEEQETA